MWVYCVCKYEGHSNILFEYSPTRNGDSARKFLGDYSGYLVCDGYDGLFAWLNELPVSGGTKLAKAVQYCLNEKPYLYRCLEDGNIPEDNNRAENAIRPFVVGRKNWLFANSVKGAKASAIIYSLAATATANGLNVEEYFTRLCRSEATLLWE